MEDIAAMLSRGLDSLMMDASMLTLTKHVYSSLPEPPVATAAPLSHAAAAWALDGVDRISLLPAVVLRNVVSRLPAKDAARTTVLSTRWRRIWHSVPLVLADEHLLPGIGTNRLPPRTADPRKLTGAVSRALSAHPGPFDVIYLTGIPMDAHRDEVALWFQILSAKGVQELVFVNRARTIETDLQLPTTLFRCSSLTRLYIGFWSFPDTATLPRAAAFPYLRELGLCSLFMKEEDLAFLLNECPVLEKLLIVGSPVPVCLRIKSCSLLCVEVCTAIVSEITVLEAPCLERLLLWETWGGGGLTNMCSKVKIGYAPKLRFLGFLVPGMHELEIGNTIIEAGTKASPNTTIPSVHMLAIQLNLGALEEARMLPSFLRCFPNVEMLYVQSDNYGINLWGTQSSVTCEFNPKFLEEAGSIECVQNNIKKLVFREFQGNRSELCFVKFIAEHAQVLEEMVIVLTHGYSPSDPVVAKLRTSMASAKWASAFCKLMVFESPFHQEGTAWCHQQAFELSNQDPFDVSRCLRGNV